MRAYDYNNPTILTSAHYFYLYPKQCNEIDSYLLVTVKIQIDCKHDLLRDLLYMIFISVNFFHLDIFGCSDQYTEISEHIGGAL
jgi:hypothetical protein